MSKNLLGLAMTLCMICVAITGCNKSNRPADLPKLYKCQLTFKQDGVPMENANIIFYSTDPSFKWSVGGSTDARGGVDIVTHGQFFGAPEGSYKIVISKTESVQEGPVRELPPDVDPASIMQAAGMLSVYTFVEKQYADVETTPLTITIAKGKNTQEYECGKAIRELLRRVAP